MYLGLLQPPPHPQGQAFSGHLSGHLSGSRSRRTQVPGQGVRGEEPKKVTDGPRDGHPSASLRLSDLHGDFGSLFVLEQRSQPVVRRPPVVCEV